MKNMLESDKIVHVNTQYMYILYLQVSIDNVLKVDVFQAKN